MNPTKISALTSASAGALAAVSLLALAGQAAAQGPGRPAPPANARAADAGTDLTGQWVSVVTEDWRWRMVTPAKGDYASVPLNAEGKKLADAWDLAADNAAGQQCRAFGVGGLMRMPTRLRISWQDPNTLKVETDAGQQTRLLHFVQPGIGNISPALEAAGPAPAERTWQGQSKAQWFKQPQSRGLGFGGGFAPGPAALRVVTRDMLAGYLRKNGVPYSEDAVVTEQFNRWDLPGGEAWMTVTTIVHDPKYLSQDFVTSTDFRKETAPGKWNPTPCRTPPPLQKAAVKTE